jgi:hypothetical protein
MIDNHITPEAIARGEYTEQVADSWFAIASARQLETFILCKKPYTRGNRNLDSVKATESIERAQILLNIRLAEDTANAVSKLIQHTEKLTVQTGKQIQHSEKLTGQTDILVAESRKLTSLTENLGTQTGILISESRQVRFLTWGLLIATFVLLLFTAGLLWVDWHRENPTVPNVSASKP